jgi:catechol 2,3-dioxygenase-like lactoylglutathione lyase family enzyme
VSILELDHTGLWVDDLEAMVEFYVELLGLQVTDRDDELGIVFLSSRPETNITSSSCRPAQSSPREGTVVRVLEPGRATAV